MIRTRKYWLIISVIVSACLFSLQAMQTEVQSQEVSKKLVEQSVIDGFMNTFKKCETSRHVDHALEEMKQYVALKLPAADDVVLFNFYLCLYQEFEKIHKEGPCKENDPDCLIVRAIVRNMGDAMFKFDDPKSFDIKQFTHTFIACKSLFSSRVAYDLFPCVTRQFIVFARQPSASNAFIGLIGLFFPFYNNNKEDSFTFFITRVITAHEQAEVKDNLIACFRELLRHLKVPHDKKEIYMAWTRSALDLELTMKKRKMDRENAPVNHKDALKK